MTQHYQTSWLCRTVLIACTSLGLAGCGFQLGNFKPNHSNALTSPIDSQSASQAEPATNQTLLLYINIDNDRQRRLLARYLRIRLPNNLQVMNTPPPDKASSTSADNDWVSVESAHIQHFDMLGILTEVRLVLSADITYHIQGQTHRQKLLSQRSYQYNEASVNTDNQQQAFVTESLYQNIAQQIAGHYVYLSQR